MQAEVCLASQQLIAADSAIKSIHAASEDAEMLPVSRALPVYAWCGVVWVEVGLFLGGLVL